MSKNPIIQQLEQEFQKKILEIKRRVESNLTHDTSQEEIMFFDEAVPSSVAYYRACGIDGLDLEKALLSCPMDCYKKVFILEPLPFEKDSVRAEDQAKIKSLNNLLPKVYKDLGYEVTLVKRFSANREISIAKRLLFILSRL